MKDVFRSGLLKLDVPYEGNTIGFMRSIFVIVIGRNQQLRILTERERERDTVKRNSRLKSNFKKH